MPINHYTHDLCCAKPNRLMMQADTAVGPRERKPKKCEGGRR
jgi:hypothetical protein